MNKFLEKAKKLLNLFLTFFKIGIFTFGGGYAMIPLVERECVSKKNWMDHNEFMDMIAIAESTPGPIAVNMATYTGFKMAGVIGSVFSTLGVILPSFIIIFVISLFFDKFLELKLVAYAFRGIQACVIYLILNAGIKMVKKLEKKPLNYILFGATLVCMTLLSVFAVKFSSIFYILIGGTLALSVYLIGYGKRKYGKKNAPLATATETESPQASLQIDKGGEGVDSDAVPVAEQHLTLQEDTLPSGEDGSEIKDVDNSDNSEEGGESL